MEKNNTLAKHRHIYFGKSAVISPEKKAVEPASEMKKTKDKWSFWGKDNNYPQRIVDSNSGDTTSSGCLRFKIEAHYGQGPLFWKRGDKNEVIPIDLEKEALSNESYKEVYEFIQTNDLENVLQGLATDYEWFNNCFSELIFNKAGSKIVEVHHADATFTRAAIIKNPIKGIESYGVSAHWKNDPKEDEIEEIPAINLRNYNTQKFKKAIYHHKLYSPGRSYYAQPSWHSNGKYIELSSQIAIWIMSNLENSINVRYHIEYPEKYFEEIVPLASFPSEEEREEAIAAKKVELFENMDKVLAGEENAGKTLRTPVIHGLDGKPLMDWKITPLATNTNHEAYLPAADVAAANIGTAHGVAPSLSGLLVSKSIGAGSGSDIREAFNVYTQLRTQIARQTTLEALYLIKKINNWPKELQFGYRNIVLETLDKNPTGSKTVVQDNGAN